MAIERRFLDVRLTIDGIVTEPTKTEVGTQYLVAATGATGVFAGHENQIAHMSKSGTWKFYPNAAGQMEVFNLEDSKIYRFDGSKWDGYSFTTTDVNAVNEDELNSRITAKVDRLVNVYLGTEADPAPDNTTWAFGDSWVNLATKKFCVVDDAGVMSESDISTGARFGSYRTNPGNTQVFVVEMDAEGELVKTYCETGTLVLNSEDRDLYLVDNTLPDRWLNLTYTKNKVYTSKAPITYSYTLTAADLTAGKFTVASDKKFVAADGVLLSIGGVVQTPNVDFELESNDTIKFSGLGMEDIGLLEGDVIVLSYNVEYSLV